MTPDEVAELDASQLEKLTDEQLLEIFKPCLTVTRPELAQANKPVNNQNKRPNAPVILMDEKKQKALAMLASEGVDMSFLNRMRLKRK